MTRRARFNIFLGILLLLILAADFLTKKWIVAHFSFGETLALFSNFFGIDFSLQFTLNRGAAWGIFSQFSSLLLMVRGAIVLALLGYLVWGHPTRWRATSLVLVIGGALGNLLDFFLYGAVVDFFAFVFWGYAYPIFNVADSAIFCGILSLLLQSTRDKSQYPTSRRDATRL